MSSDVVFKKLKQRVMGWSPDWPHLCDRERQFLQPCACVIRQRHKRHTTFVWFKWQASYQRLRIPRPLPRQHAIRTVIPFMRSLADSLRAYRAIALYPQGFKKFGLFEPSGDVPGGNRPEDCFSLLANWAGEMLWMFEHDHIQR